MSLGGSNSSQRSFYKPALPFLQQFSKVGNQWLQQWQPDGAAATAGKAAIAGDVNGAGYDDPYLPAAARAIQTQAADRLATTQSRSDQQAAASGMLNSSKNTQVRGANVRDSSDAVTNALNQLGSANYTQGRQLQIAAAPQAVAAGQSDYDKAIQIAQLFGGLGSGSSLSRTSVIGQLL